MLEKLGVEESNLIELCTVLYKHYGTTMAGLKVIKLCYIHVLLLFDKGLRLQ